MNCKNKEIRLTFTLLLEQSQLQYLCYLMCLELKIVNPNKTGHTVMINKNSNETRGWYYWYWMRYTLNDKKFNWLLMIYSRQDSIWIIIVLPKNSEKNRISKQDYSKNNHNWSSRAHNRAHERQKKKNIFCNTAKLQKKNSDLLEHHLTSIKKTFCIFCRTGQPVISHKCLWRKKKFNWHP